MINRKDYAVHYFDHGFIPIPLCWTKNQKCACFMNHTEPKHIGKAPLVSYTGREITRQMIEEWFTRYPLANIGILIAESGLVVVDCDSEEAVADFEKSVRAVSLIPTVISGRGKHYYFRADIDTPEHRAIHTGRTGMTDIFSNGYIVAPPSIHKNGHQYKWSNPPKNTGLPIVPPHIADFLIFESAQKNSQAVSAEITITENKDSVVLAELPLNDFIKSIIKLGELSPYYRQRGYKTKSEALHGMMIACYEKGLTDDQVFSIFSNPRNAMSYKYIENKRSDNWLKTEMGRAKAKKNSRSLKTATHTLSKLNLKGLN